MDSRDTNPACAGSLGAYSDSHRIEISEENNRWNKMALGMKKETVNHPTHYGGDTVYEHIKVVEAWGLNYALGNATKYIARAGKKTENAVEDLRKAIWYIQHEIERLEKK